MLYTVRVEIRKKTGVMALIRRRELVARDSPSFDGSYALGLACLPQLNAREKVDDVNVNCYRHMMRNKLLCVCFFCFC